MIKILLAQTFKLAKHPFPYGIYVTFSANTPPIHSVFITTAIFSMFKIKVIKFGRMAINIRKLYYCRVNLK